MTALDKLDKVGREAVEQEMRDKGVSEAAVHGHRTAVRAAWELGRTTDQG